MRKERYVLSPLEEFLRRKRIARTKTGTRLPEETKRKIRESHRKRNEIISRELER